MRYGSAKRDAGILRPPVKDSYVVEATIWDTRDGDGVYGGTKAFVLSLSQSLHHEFADKGVRVQVVLPGATSTAFWDTAGMPVSNLPADRLMPVGEIVDAALAGLDLGELVTIPSLPHMADWDALEAARRKLTPHLSRAHPAARYRTRPADA